MDEGGPIAGLSADSEAAMRRAADHAVRFRRNIDERPIGPAEDYPTMLARFGGLIPETGTPSAEIIDELAALAEPGLMAFPNPRFFGWVVGASQPVGVAADWLTSAWGQNAKMSATTPAAAAAEETAGHWMLDLLDLPRDAGFGFTTGATMANAIGLAAARNALLARVGWDVEAKGLFGAPEVHVVLGEEAHATVFMGLRLIGFGAERVIDIIEDGGGLIVCMESCTGIKPIWQDVEEDTGDPMTALARKYMDLPCSVMTANDRRMDLLTELAARFKAECIVDLSWQACLTYDVESCRVKQLAEDTLGLPYLRISTDYSPSDTTRIALRVEALLETVRSRQGV